MLVIVGDCGSGQWLWLVVVFERGQQATHKVSSRSQCHQLAFLATPTRGVNEPENAVQAKGTENKQDLSPKVIWPARDYCVSAA